MITKYKINGRYPEAEIEEVEVLRETARCIFVPVNKNKSNPAGERKELKMTDWAEHYDTWDDAYAALKEKVERKVAYASRELKLANSLAEKVKSMLPNTQ